MTLMPLVKTFIYLVSGALLFPVLLALAGLVLWLILHCGIFLSELLERVKIKTSPPEKLADHLISDEKKHHVSHRVLSYLRKLNSLRSSRGAFQDREVEYLIQSETANYLKSLDKLKMLIRVGPSLGLIGTLIPMGTGLAGLGQGDMTTLTADLVVAFTTTVVGLGEGTVAFCLFQIKKRWIEEDIRQIEFATELITTSPASTNSETQS